MIIHPTNEIRIVSGEGEGPATVERFTGKHTQRAIKRRLTRERCHGDRWAYAVQYARGAGALTLGYDLETDDTRLFPGLTVDPKPKRPRGGARKGAGRPRGRRNRTAKPPEECVTAQTLVRLTPTERTRLATAAGRIGISLSAVIRRAIRTYLGGAGVPR